MTKLGQPENSFKKEYTSEGFTETLFFNGITYIKRYKKDHSGWRGIDKAWDYTKEIPDRLIEALNDQDDECLMMEALSWIEKKIGKIFKKT